MTEAATGGSTEYINHHLHFWRVKVGDSTFMTLNVDTLIFTFVLSALFLLFLHPSARKATSGVPGKFRPSSRSWSAWSTASSAKPSTAAAS